MAERILVVDDEPNMLKLLKTILMDRTGYEVDTTNSPLEVGRLPAKMKEDGQVAIISDSSICIIWHFRTA